MSEFPEDFKREVKMEYYRAGVSSLRESGFLALKTLVTLNSGAFVVLLTFIGNTAAQSKFSVPLEALQQGMYAFLAGLVCVFCSIAQTYISSWNSTPYYDDTQPDRLPNGLKLMASIFFPVASFLSFFFGVVVVVSNVGPAP